MQIKLYGLLRQAAGIKMMDVDVQAGQTVGDILGDVTQRYPALEKYIWKAPGELSDIAHVFVNSENIRHLSGLDTAVKAEDRVDIFPPVVGG
jgi:molybdopterin synthase sulfur carrier subunit